MSMSSDAMVAGQEALPSAETGTIFLADIHQNKNHITYPISGTKGLLINNRSCSPVLVILSYGQGSGGFSVVVDAWDCVPIVLQSPVVEIDLYSMMGSPLPNGVLPVGTGFSDTGYLSITQLSDSSTIEKTPFEVKAPPWYRTSGSVSIPANTQKYIAGGADVAVTFKPLIDARILDIFNLDNALPCQFAWFVGPLAILTQTVGGFLTDPPGVGNTLSLFTLGPGQAASFPIPSMPRYNLYVIANNPSATTALNVQCIVRGY